MSLMSQACCAKEWFVYLPLNILATHEIIESEKCTVSGSGRKVGNLFISNGKVLWVKGVYTLTNGAAARIFA